MGPSPREQVTVNGLSFVLEILKFDGFDDEEEEQQEDEVGTLRHGTDDATDIFFLF